MTTDEFPFADANTRVVKIKWDEVQKIIETILKLGGIDPSKEMTKWCLWENNKITLCYAQKIDAQALPIQQEQKQVSPDLTARPAYLQGRTK